MDESAGAGAPANDGRSRCELHDDIMEWADEDDEQMEMMLEHAEAELGDKFLD